MDRNKGWYASSYRKLFFDYHSHSSAVGLASAFDAEKWAQKVQDAHAQAVSVFVKGGRGWSFYRKGHVRHVHPQLPDGLDMLEEQIRAMHKRGIKVIGYYHTFGSEPVGKDHPDWAMRDINGNKSGDSICMLGPLLEEHMLPHVREVLENYGLDGMFFDGTYAGRRCYCDSCKERFRNEVGGQLPADDKDPLWPKYVKWELEAFQDVRSRISDAIHKIHPDMPVSYNVVYTMNMPEIVPDHVGNLMIDVPPDDQAFNGSYQARYWATLRLPFDIMNSAFLQWWGDWGSKPAVGLQQEVATAIANGGLTWIGYQMTHEFDVQPAVMEQMGKALEFVKEREHLLEGAEPIPNIGILNSTANHFAGGVAHTRTDEIRYRGAHRLFMEVGMPHHFLNEDILIKNMKEYKAVVLPDVRYISSEMASALKKYVQDGGVLLTTYRTGTEDDSGNKQDGSILSDLSGVELEDDYTYSEAYIEITEEGIKKNSLDMPLLVHGKFALAKPKSPDMEVVAKLKKVYVRADGQFLLRSSPVGEDSGYPAITRRSVGKGMVIYIAGQVFRGYQTHGQWCLKPVIANLLNDAIQKPLVQLESPAWLEVVLMRQDKRTLVHLVNFHGNRPFNKNNLCVEQILPVRDVKIRLAIDKKPEKVCLEPGGHELEWNFGDDALEINVPEVYIHYTIVIEI